MSQKKKHILVAETELNPIASDSAKYITALSDDDLLRLRFNITFANFINHKRTHLGWTQEDLAQKSHVNRVTISKIERFHQTASMEVMLKILKAFDMTICFAGKDGKNTCLSID